MPLTEQEETLLYTLLKQEDRERVAPKFEAWRDPARYKVAYGGRGAGSKSWSCASLLVQKCEYSDKPVKVLCVREVQKSLEESSHALIAQTIDRLGFADWDITDSHITNKRNGSTFRFRGLKDIRAARQIKSYEGFDILFAEEAATISYESWHLILPTFRKPGSEIWAIFNREEEIDPVYDLFVVNERPNSIVLSLDPGPADNPWWNETTLPQEMEEDFKRDPDLAEHVWYGYPRKQGQSAVLSRSRIRAAMDRKLPAEGPRQIGVDPARYGDDRTEVYMRHGMRIVEHREFIGQDTMRTANEAWSLANHDPSVLIVVDETGIGSGVVDKLVELGAKVLGVNFGGRSSIPSKYTSVADELWFEFPVDDADIPDDQELMKELSGRRYNYDRSGRYKIESKDEYKKRLGYSPDKADALLLCYFQGGGAPLDPKHRQAMRRRRQKNH